MALILEAPNGDVAEELFFDSLHVWDVCVLNDNIVRNFAFGEMDFTAINGTAWKNGVINFDPLYHGQFGYLRAQVNQRGLTRDYVEFALRANGYEPHLVYGVRDTALKVLRTIDNNFYCPELAV